MANCLSIKYLVSELCAFNTSVSLLLLAEALNSTLDSFSHLFVVSVFKHSISLERLTISLLHNLAIDSRIL